MKAKPGQTRAQIAVLLVLLLSVAMGGCKEEKGLKIKGIEPKSGPADGAGTVTILGNGFKADGAKGVKVYFGDRQATFLRFEGDTKMMVVPPPGEEGKIVDLQIIFDDGREHRFEKAYTYIDQKAGFDVDALAPSK